MIAATASCVERRRSVSSMRSRKIPPSPCSWWWRAKSQLNSAVRAPPMWRKPVGEGAKRTTTAMTGALSSTSPGARHGGARRAASFRKAGPGAGSVGCVSCLFIRLQPRRNPVGHANRLRGDLGNRKIRRRLGALRLVLFGVHARDERARDDLRAPARYAPFHRAAERRKMLRDDREEIERMLGCVRRHDGEAHAVIMLDEQQRISAGAWTSAEGARLFLDDLDDLAGRLRQAGVDAPGSVGRLCRGKPGGGARR